MKKPERMKNKTTKAFLYQNLYPVNLYVTTLDDWEDACDFFDFFLTTKELRNDEPENEELEDLFHEFIKEEEICTYNHDNRREAGQNSVESRSDVDVPSTDTKGIKQKSIS